MSRRDPSPGVRLVAEALKSRALSAAMDAWVTEKNMPRRGRPPKAQGEDYDTQRARIIFEAASAFQGHLKIRQWIAVCREIAAEKGGKAKSLFPKYRGLESSISRGARKLGLPRHWNRRKLAKK